MRISAVDALVVDFYRTNLIFLRVHTDEGIVGVGEATLEGKERAVLGAIEEVAEAVVGLDPTSVAKITRE
ncbi:MAG: mandelate racemase, partial [Actinomycetota bacterium]|nr:mandelate racemase [Actinomycetota bacterium]